LVRFALESKFKSLPEFFSGDSPHEPGGTTSQAWSVAELLRLIVEYEIVDT
jgi:glycogen debranching enzyme